MRVCKAYLDTLSQGSQKKVQAAGSRARDKLRRPLFHDNESDIIVNNFEKI